jgi:hypothetical protein
MQTAPLVLIFVLCGTGPSLAQAASGCKQSGLARWAIRGRARGLPQYISICAAD